MSIDLYLTVYSPPCRAVLFVAKQLGIELNLKELNLRNGEHLKPKFIKINPAHSVPTIVDNGFALWESRAINQYLCNQYASDSDLYPNDPKRRAIVDRILNFDIGTFSPAVMDVLIVKIRERKEPDEQKVKAFNNSLSLLDTFIGDNKYVTGNHFTIADLSILAFVGMLRIANIDFSEYPRITEWYDRLESELPYFNELQEKAIKIFPTILSQQRTNAQQ